MQKHDRARATMSDGKRQGGLGLPGDCFASGETGKTFAMFSTDTAALYATPRRLCLSKSEREVVRALHVVFEVVEGNGKQTEEHKSSPK